MNNTTEKPPIYVDVFGRNAPAAAKANVGAKTPAEIAESAASLRPATVGAWRNDDR